MNARVSRKLWSLLGVVALLLVQLLPIAAAPVASATGPSEPPTGLPAHLTLMGLGSGESDPPDLPEANWMLLRAEPCILRLKWNYDPYIDIYVKQKGDWWLAEENLWVAALQWYEFDLRQYEEFSPIQDATVAVITHTGWREDFRNDITIPACEGSICITKIDQDGNDWAGVTVNLYQEGNLIATGQTPTTFGELENGDYVVEEVPPIGSVPMGPVSYTITVETANLNHAVQFQNERPEPPQPKKEAEHWYLTQATIRDPLRFSRIKAMDNRPVFAMYVGEEIGVTGIFTNHHSGGYLPGGRKVGPVAHQVELSYAVRRQVDEKKDLWEKTDGAGISINAILLSRGGQAFRAKSPSSGTLFLGEIPVGGVDEVALAIKPSVPGLISVDFKVTFWDRVHHEVRGHDASVMVLVEKAPSPNQVATHTVKPGECLSLIAAHYGVTQETLIQANVGNYSSLAEHPDNIWAGWVFTIPTA